ncbi:hypothetical protein RclHR1_13940006 [Rhizophagus clarus]|uniref:BTB domain-containing protein n=1 Tax=Rhizophagus clarus TaxID=94130 RepID=A0A2Z6R3W9_9GLOM|nr:hypothetical protein RclHR1_13940006 [Rhizophagus clarus]
MFKGMIYYFKNKCNGFQTMTPSLSHFRSSKITHSLIRLKQISSGVSKSKIVPKKGQLKRKGDLWTDDEFKTLENAVKLHGKDWNYISKNYFFDNRTPAAISIKWRCYLTKDDLKTLEYAVSKHGKNWDYISKEYFNNNRAPKILSAKWERFKNELKKPKNIVSKLKDRNNTIREPKKIKCSRNHWTDKEIRTLKKAVKEYGHHNLEFISKKYFQDSRSVSAISSKWRTLNSCSRNRWTENEDKLLFDLIKKHGMEWKKISKLMNRTCDSISKRYDKITRKQREKNTELQTRLTRQYRKNHLMYKDYDKLQKLVDKYGKDWTQIAKIMNRSKDSLEKSVEKSLEKSLESSFLRDIRQLFHEADDYNVLIEVGQEPTIKTFKAHSVILRARSAYFRAALSTNWAKTNDGIIKMNKPNITPDVFHVILKFMYTGTIVLSDNMLPHYLDILVAADELALIDLIDYIVEYILKKEMFWFRRNLVKIHRISSQHEAFHKLKTSCEEIIQKDAPTFLRSKDIGNLEENILIKLLKSDNLDLKEIEIWNQIIKWGKVQCSLNGNDKENIEDWTNEDFEMLKLSLTNCLSHIRFFLISGADYHDKIRPFKKILSKELKNELREFYIAGRKPNRLNLLSPRLKYADEESLLIKLNHFTLISSWIDRKKQNYQPEQIPYVFKLLYRGSRDGLKEADKFYQKCNYQGPTIVIVKPFGGNQIIGGYNADIWNKNQKYDTVTNSFIFSLVINNNENDTGICSRVKSNVNKVGCAGQEKLPWFGNDLNWIKGVCKQQIYERKIVDFEKFNTEDVEVYKVLLKVNNNIFFDEFNEDDNTTTIFNHEIIE